VSEEIKVTVVEFGDRAHYQMQFRDPFTGKKKTRSTGVERGGAKARKEAEKAAGKWEAELREGRFQNTSKMTWQAFRDRYEKDVLTSLAEGTDAKVQGVFNSLESILAPARLRDLTAERLSHYQSKLRENGLAESTIAGMLAHLRAALNWAAKMGMLPKAPAIERPKRAKSSKIMKGRPITLEEFERMLAKVADVVTAELAEDAEPVAAAEREEAIAAWKFYLRGLWASGLRLGESMDLDWERPDRLRVDMDGKRPMLHIPAELEKGNADRLLPMAPEFAELLQSVPVEERTGPVFKLVTRRGKRPTEWSVSKALSAIGEKAGVKVDQREKGGKAAVKFASAHDLRRSFGARWATRVMPQVLMELMRHESIETTLRFYVGKNAETTADVLWAAHEAASNKSGNSRVEETANA
jgi:integrase